MIELVIVYCLTADTNSCTEKRLAMEDFPDTCRLHDGRAATRPREYLQAHPKYMLKSWRCEMDVPHQQPA